MEYRMTRETHDGGMLTVLLEGAVVFFVLGALVGGCAMYAVMAR